MAQDANARIDRKKAAVEDKIRDWLQGQGYPMEMRIAAELQRLKLHTTLANYYIDPVSQNSRQIDIIASREHPSGYLNVELVIECKRSSKRPWLVLSAQHSDDFNGSGFEYALTSGEARIALTSNQQALSALPWWNWDKPRGVGIVPAFGDGPDDAYKAASGVMAASIARQQMLLRRAADMIIFIFPIVVVDNALFECGLKASGDIEVKQIQEAKVYMPMHFGNFSGTCVHVVAASYIEEFCREASLAIEALSKLCAPIAQEKLDVLLDMIDHR